MIVERDGGFEVQSEDGKTLGIHATHRAALNHLAAIEWSKAQRMAEGGPVLSLDDAAQPQSIPEPTIPLAIEPGSITSAPQAEPSPRVWPSERERLSGITDAERAARGDLPVGAGGSPEEIARNQAYTTWAQTGVGPKPPPVAPIGSQATPQGEHPWTLPASQESLARGAMTQPHAPAKESASPVAPKMSLDDAFARGSESPGERAQREMEQAVEKKGQIQQANYLAQQSELQRQDEERQQAQRDFMAAQKDNERLHQEWAAKVPDQNRWWNSKSTGNKIGSAIAMIVGGFASGMAGQKNQALAVIEDSIAKDVQAQADQKNSMVSFYLQRGKDMKEAYALTASNLMLSAASRMEQLKASMGAQMVGPDTDLAINGLRVQAAQLQQAAGLKALEARKTMAEIGKIGAETSKLRADAAKSYVDANLAARQSQGIQYGQAVRQEDLGRIPPGERSKFVHIGDGQWLPAVSEEQGKLAQGEIETGKSLASTLARLEELGKGQPIKGGANYAEALSLAKSIMADLRGAMGLGVLSESDKEMLEEMTPHPEQLLTFDATNRGRMATMRRIANKSISRAYSRLGRSTPEVR